jgi:hypothetical protein
MPTLPYVVFDAPELTSLQPESIVEIVDGLVDEVIDGLIGNGKGSASQVREAPSVQSAFLQSETFSGADSLEAWENFNEDFLDRGWGDGFPLIAPTPQRVEKMLKQTRRDPTEIIAALEPGFGLATVEKLAINAVMAGCKPEHLPVVIAATQAMSDPKYWLKNVATSTGPHAPMLVLNGPIVDRLGFNYGRGALGPGRPSRVNTVVGRAMRLVLMNIGLSYVGSLDLDTIGSPNKYSMCLAENEKESPWVPYHVEKGYDRAQSTVTVFSVESQLEMFDTKNYTPEAICNGFVGTVGGVGSAATRQWLVPRRHADNAILLGPTHAHAIAEHGWLKDDVKRYIYEHSRIKAGMLINTQELGRIMPGMQWILDADPETLLPITGAYDWFHVIVVGGPVGKSSYTAGLGQCVTRVIEEDVASG